MLSFGWFFERLFFVRLCLLGFLKYVTRFSFLFLHIILINLDEIFPYQTAINKRYRSESIINSECYNISKYSYFNKFPFEYLCLS
jgi:hypothetical protein